MQDNVLLVADEDKVSEFIERLFLDASMKILKASSADEALSIFRQEEVAVMVSDYCVSDTNDINIFSQVRELSPDTIGILMTAQTDLTLAVDSVNRGDVFRFILKPLDSNELLHMVLEAVKRYRIVQSLKRFDEAALISISRSIELKDPYTQGHCERVTQYALMISDELKLPDDTRTSIKFGGWLHDCGKIGIPESILNKEAPLDESEYDIIKKHPRLGADVAAQANLSSQIINIILYHHERFDGAGYPSGRGGEEIPLESRIVTIADVYDAITSNRAYRKKYCREKALKIMAMMRGNVFDPELADIFLHKCLGISKDELHTLLIENLN
jgi:putative nucleotidyltransferase with HDIG domain